MSGDRKTVLTADGVASEDTVQQDAANPTPATPPSVRIKRERLGRYTILRQLGRGGMGTVFEADDPELGRHVAIKVLRDDRNDPRLTEGLRREAQALAKLVHPNVVTVYDVGVADGQVYVVMQLVDGDTIDRWLRARNAPPGEIVAAFRQAGRGLAAAHAAGLVHCDFKPSNVLVDHEAVVRVTDFGLARFGFVEAGASPTATSIAGTPAYMPPEQFENQPTAASDQYSFCVALHEVLAGERPFADTTGSTAETARARIARPLPRAARVPGHVARALERGLAVDPAARFPSMDALLAALTPPMTRKRILLAAAGLVVIGGSITAGVLAASRDRAPVIESYGEADVTRLHALTHFGASGCAYAPAIDGDGVVFEATQGDAVGLYRVPLAGGEPRQLTSALAPEWHPNPGRHVGEVIHVIDDPNALDRSMIAFLDVATGRETPAVRHRAVDAGVLADGIVYIIEDGGELRRSTGDRDVLLAKPKTGRFGHLAVAHRGDRIAVAGANASGELCVFELATAAMTCGEGYGARPAFGADDRELYVYTVDGVKRRDLATGKMSMVLAGEHASGGLAVTPDGGALVYSDCDAHAKIVDMTTQPPAVLVDHDVIKPSATSLTRLVWVHLLGQTPVLMARTEDGHDVQLTDVSLGPITAPSISPDGERVAFIVTGRPHPGIYVAELRAGAQPQQITKNLRVRRPSWVDPTHIAFTEVEDRDVPTVMVASSRGGDQRHVGTASRTVIGSRHGQVLAKSSTDLLWIDVESGKERPFEFARSSKSQLVATSPDGRWLVWQDSETQVVWRMSLDPMKAPEEVGRLKTGETADMFAITNDGHVITAVATWTGDLHVVPPKPGAKL